MYIGGRPRSVTCKLKFFFLFYPGLFIILRKQKNFMNKKFIVSVKLKISHKYVLS